MFLFTHTQHSSCTMVHEWKTDLHGDMWGLTEMTDSVSQQTTGHFSVFIQMMFHGF